MEADKIRRKRLLYRCQHRGFKEADLIIGGFAAANLAKMGDSEIDAFEALIALPDHDVCAFIFGEKRPPPEHDTPVLAALRAFHSVTER